jgi:hypothetical protein
MEISPAASVLVTVGEAPEVGEGLTVPEAGVVEGGVLVMTGILDGEA